MDYEEKEEPRALSERYTDEELAEENRNGWMLHSASPWMYWGLDRVGWVGMRYVFRRKVDKKPSV